MPRSKNPIGRLVDGAKGTAAIGRMVAGQVGRTAVAAAGGAVKGAVGAVTDRAGRGKVAHTDVPAARATSPAILRPVPSPAPRPRQEGAGPKKAPVAKSGPQPGRRRPDGGEEGPRRGDPGEEDRCQEDAAKKAPAKKTAAKKAPAEKPAATKSAPGTGCRPAGRRRPPRSRSRTPRPAEPSRDSVRARGRRTLDRS